jgi:hypothetical protein
MESVNKTLSATVSLFIGEMRVTRNCDDGKAQDPFFTLHQFRLIKKAFDKVPDKYKHDLFSKPMFKKKSKVIKDGGKEVNFKEVLELACKM